MRLVNDQPSYAGLDTVFFRETRVGFVERIAQLLTLVLREGLAVGGQIYDLTITRWLTTHTVTLASARIVKAVLPDYWRASPLPAWHG